MNILDIILIVIILLFAVWGFRKGFLQTLGGLIGIVIAVIIASRFYLKLGDLFGGTNFAQVISFILIFVVIVKVVTLVFWALGKVFQVIAVLPFLHSAEKALGAVLGLAEGILLLAVLIFILSKYPVSDWLTWQMKDSIMTAVLLKIAYVFLPLLPEATKKLKSII